MNCYQCDAAVNYLFPDGRCGKCTRISPEELTGAPINDPTDEETALLDSWSQEYPHTPPGIPPGHSGADVPVRGSGHMRTLRTRRGDLLDAQPVSAERAEWDRRLIRLAFHVASWSRDPSTKVGAVITRPDYSVLTLGFNHFPPEVPDTAANYADREFKHKHVRHAEVDALAQLPNRLAPDCFVYTSFPVCPACVEALGVAGVARIVEPPLRSDGKDEFWFREWRTKIIESMRLSDEYGIDRRVIHDV